MYFCIDQKLHADIRMIKNSKYALFKKTFSSSKHFLCLVDLNFI